MEIDPLLRPVFFGKEKPVSSVFQLISEKEKPYPQNPFSDWWMIQICLKQVKPGAPDFKGLKNCVEIFKTVTTSIVQVDILQERQ